MSKELRAFSKERQALDELYDVAGNVQNLKEDYIILKSALQRLEAIDKKRCGANVEKVIIDEFVPSKAIDNSNPSEALDSLENMYTFSEDTIYQFEKEYKVIKQYILKAQEQEKENAEYEEVLKLVFDRKVDIYHLSKSKTVEDYNSIWDSSTYCLTEEEFDLLKRYFGNEGNM